MLAMVALATAAHVRAQCTNSWLPVTPGPNAAVRAMTSWDPDGSGPQPAVVIVGGGFSTIGGMQANGIAAFDPVLGTWSALPGVGQGAVVLALAVMANGDLVAGGAALGASGTAGVVRWNGSGWAPLGSGVGTSVTCLLPLPNGDLIIGRNGNSVPPVLHWNGASWSPMFAGLGSVGFIGMDVKTLARMTNGDIVAGGIFSCAGGWHLARWNGAGWTAMVPNLTSTDFVQTTVALPNDGLAVAHQFAVTLWNGATWSGLATPNSAMPFTSVLSLASNGDLIAGGGSFVGVARWDGAEWSTFGGGLASGASAFANAPNGDLLVGGSFTNPGGVASPNIVRVTTSCPSSVATYGSGCAGSGGLNVMSAVTLPWIGSTFRARAVGMPPLALVLSVYGFTTQSIPFNSVLPASLPGCTILMTGDLIDVLCPDPAPWRRRSRCPTRQRSSATRSITTWCRSKSTWRSTSPRSPTRTP